MPTKQPMKGVVKRAIVIPDVHAPLHDPAAVDIVLQAIKVVRPEICIFLGDVGEFEGASSWQWKKKKRPPLEYQLPAVYRDIDDFTNRNGIVPEEESLYLGVRAIGEDARQAVVLPVEKPLDIGADQLALVADVVQSTAVHQRCRSDTLLGPVVPGTRRQLVVCRLPKKFACRLIKADHHPLVAGNAPAKSTAVIGSHEDPAVGDDRIAVGRGPNWCDPLDVPVRFQIPRNGDVGFARHHVSIRRAAVHRPVPRLSGWPIRRRGNGHDVDLRAGARRHHRDQTENR